MVITFETDRAVITFKKKICETTDNIQNLIISQPPNSNKTLRIKITTNKNADLLDYLDIFVIDKDKSLETQYMSINMSTIFSVYLGKDSQTIMYSNE